MLGADQKQFLETLRHGSPEAQRRLAAQPDLPPAAAVFLAKNAGASVKRTLLKNETLHPHVVSILAADENFIVRATVARSPWTPHDLWEQFGSDSSDAVVVAAAENPTVSVDALMRLFDKVKANPTPQKLRGVSHHILLRGSEFRAWLEENQPQMLLLPEEWMFGLLGFPKETVEAMAAVVA